MITPEAERWASLLQAGLRRGLSGQLLLAELRRACLGIYLARCQTELAGRLRRGVAVAGMSAELVSSANRNVMR